MRVLALDTTTRRGSVALVDDGRVVVGREGDHTKTHAERLPRELVDAASEAGLSVCEIDLFAVAAGPGSFTGLRIGIAAMQGLAVVCRRRIVAVSALEALAHAAAAEQAPGTRVAAWMDAHRGDVFSALFHVVKGDPFSPERLIELDPARVDRPDLTWRTWRERTQLPHVIAGDATALYADTIGEESTVVSSAAPLAIAIGQMALRRAHAAVSPAGVHPVYVRRPDVEVTRDRRRDA